MNPEGPNTSGNYRAEGMLGEYVLCTVQWGMKHTSCISEYGDVHVYVYHVHVYVYGSSKPHLIWLRFGSPPPFSFCGFCEWSQAAGLAVV